MKRFQYAVAWVTIAVGVLLIIIGIDIYSASAFWMGLITYIAGLLYYLYGTDSGT